MARLPPPAAVAEWWIVQDRGGDFRENCPSTAAIPARILLEPTEDEDAAVEAILAGSVVFYGAFFHGAADAMNTPLHNDLPAVFLHSTALDNLITLGPPPCSTASHRSSARRLAARLPPAGAIGAFFVARRTSTRFAAAGMV